MEKRDAVFLLLLAGGGAYAAYTHWDEISARLGLDELEPGRIKAVVLAKQDCSMGHGMTNWQHIQSRRDLGEIAIAAEPWVAEPLSGQDYRVTVQWTDHGMLVVNTFVVNTADRTVVHQGETSVPASPR